ncbi:MAG TPA: NAD-dependent deacylase [Polyangiaceae bacterium]|nr:NAD-dependent deacylase [Polyangiaceae bacterium]
MTAARFDEFGPIEIGPTHRVFVLTGAGISAESGVRTFRDANGLWEQYRVETVASPEGWAADPGLVWRFYSQRRAQVETVSPNAAHVALAALEKRLGDRLFLCTQNVDPLHERAGSTRVWHMHGELLKSRCENESPCGRAPIEDHRLYESVDAIARCECGARLRPHIVWFGEVPFFMDEIARAIASCDVFVTIGSSGAVYPAAGFVRAARARPDVRTVYVGPEIPDNAHAFDECRLGKATEVVPSLFEVG